MKSRVLRLAAIVSKCHPLRGGAQTTIWTLLENLAVEYRAECLLLTPHPVPCGETVGAVGLRTYRDAEQLKDTVRSFRPDALLGALEEIPDAARVARLFGAPLLLYLNSFELYDPTEEEKKAWGVSLSRTYLPAVVAGRMLRQADLVLANSRFMRDLFAAKYGVEPEILYPTFHPNQLGDTGKKPTGDAITGVCGYRYKGLDIFLELARRLPNHPFQLVGEIDSGFEAACAELPNVSRMGWVSPRDFLSRAKVVVVPSRWPEPFGRIAVEAMANGIPVLVSATGGLPEIAGDSAFVVDAFRNPDAWHERLEGLLASEEAYRDASIRGRALTAPFLQARSGRELWKAVDRARPRSPAYERRNIIVRGESARHTAFSAINARWRQLLSQAPRNRVLGGQGGQEADDGMSDVTIHHDYSARFSDVCPPDTGYFIAVRTWDFGPYPPAWTEKINTQCDQLWVYSEWVARQAVESGISREKVRIVPVGVDEAVLRPEGRRLRLPTDKNFRFLFVGATVHRKGADILLDAYREAFRSDDDVCLVIKDHSQDVFYQGISFRDRVRDIQLDPAAPEVLYLDEYLTADDLAALYRTCDMGVFPYRAEGFCMPILEAMACGLPSIAPNFGACLDYCSDATSLLMPVRRISLPVPTRFAINTLGFEEEIDAVDFCEVERGTLTAFLRRARELSAPERRGMGRAGVREAHGRFTWSDVQRRMEAALDDLDRLSEPARFRAGRRNEENAGRAFAAASELYADLIRQRVRGKSK